MVSRTTPLRRHIAWAFFDQYFSFLFFFLILAAAAAAQGAIDSQSVSTFVVPQSWRLPRSPPNRSFTRDMTTSPATASPFGTTFGIESVCTHGNLPDNLAGGSLDEWHWHGMPTAKNPTIRDPPESRAHGSEKATLLLFPPFWSQASNHESNARGLAFVEGEKLVRGPPDPGGILAYVPT
jgi:hypothetical protein